MAGAFSNIYSCKTTLRILGIHATYRAHPARARRGEDDRSFTCPEDSLLEEPPSSGLDEEATAGRQLSSHPVAVSRWERRLKIDTNALYFYS